MIFSAYEESTLGEIFAEFCKGCRSLEECPFDLEKGQGCETIKSIEQLIAENEKSEEEKEAEALWVKTKWGQHRHSTPDLIDLALAVLSSASSLIQTDEPRGMHCVKGKLNLAAENVKHMQGQVKFRLSEKGKG